MKAERKAYEKVIRMIAHEVNNSMAGVNSMLDSVSAAVEDIGDDDLLELIKVCEQRCHCTCSRSLYCQKSLYP